jgi:hypothetical protein
MNREQSTNDTYTDEEIALRMNNAVRRALNTPPKPLKGIPKKSEKPALPHQRRSKAVQKD